MNRFCFHAVLAIFCTAAITLGAPVNAAATAEQDALQADSSFVQALAKGDKAEVGKLLDPEFTWTDANGHTLKREQVLRELPKPAIGVETGKETSATLIKHNYGNLEAIQQRSGRDNVLRVWVKRPDGWRQLVYQEARLLDTAPTAPPGTGADCENPCKSLPYQPKNANERAVLKSFQELQAATVAQDSAIWGQHVADEFSAANSNSDQVLTKQGRMSDLEHKKMAGYSPMPVQSMRLFDFGDAFVLQSDHQPQHGKPVHITRVWIKRDGRWQEAASYQTRVDAAPAMP